MIHTLSQHPQITRTAAPTLNHPDLHKRNIFVSDDDPTVVTGIIDWQSSSIYPAFEYADEQPDFAAPTPDPSLEDRPPDRFAEICQKAYDACLKALVPKLATARAIDNNLLRPFRYCHRTWRDGAVAFRDELIDISKRWKELGLPGYCPYPHPTSGELAVHRKEVERYMTAQRLKERLASLLNVTSDGWVPTEAWETTKMAHKESYYGLIQAMQAVNDAAVNDVDSTDEESLSSDDLKELWPFECEWLSCEEANQDFETPKLEETR